MAPLPDMLESVSHLVSVVFTDRPFDTNVPLPDKGQIRYAHCTAVITKFR